jgi:hypothetical protein
MTDWAGANMVQFWVPPQPPGAGAVPSPDAATASEMQRAAESIEARVR